jgi:hypothetical protein
MSFSIRNKGGCVIILIMLWLSGYKWLWEFSSVVMMEIRHLRIISTVLVPLKPQPTRTNVILLYIYIGEKNDHYLLHTTIMLWFSGYKWFWNFYPLVIIMMESRHTWPLLCWCELKTNQPTRKNVVLLYLLESGMIITCFFER